MKFKKVLPWLFFLIITIPVFGFDFSSEEEAWENEDDGFTSEADEAFIKLFDEPVLGESFDEPTILVAEILEHINSSSERNTKKTPLQRGGYL